MSARSLSVTSTSFLKSVPLERQADFVAPVIVAARLRGAPDSAPGPPPAFRSTCLSPFSFLIRKRIGLADVFERLSFGVFDLPFLDVNRARCRSRVDAGGETPAPC